jgi:hypothetical protein
MSKKRRQYSPQFKSKVALEAIQGVKTVPELSSKGTSINCLIAKILGLKPLPFRCSSQ